MGLGGAGAARARSVMELSLALRRRLFLPSLCPAAKPSMSTSVRWPVSSKNTSSRLGSLSERPRSSEELASTRRSASAPTSGPLSTVNSTMLPSTWTDFVVRSPRVAATATASSWLARVSSSTVAPRSALRSGRRAVGDDLPVVDDDDLLGEPVGLFEVLRREQDRGSACPPAPRSRPRARRGSGGRGRWSARRGRSPGAVRRGRRRGRAGGACHRSRS